MWLSSSGGQPLSHASILFFNFYFRLFPVFPPEAPALLRRRSSFGGQDRCLRINFRYPSSSGGQPLNHASIYIR